MDRQTDRRTDRRRTKLSLCVAMLRRRHKKSDLKGSHCPASVNSVYQCDGRSFCSHTLGAVTLFGSHTLLSKLRQAVVLKIDQNKKKWNLALCLHNVLNMQVKTNIKAWCSLEFLVCAILSPEHETMLHHAIVNVPTMLQKLRYNAHTCKNRLLKNALIYKLYVYEYQ